MRRLNRRLFLIYTIFVLLTFTDSNSVAAQESTTTTILEQNINPVPEGEAIIALNINDKRYGDVEARIDMDDPFLKVELLREVLSPSLSPAIIERLFSITLSKLKWAGIADLETAGLAASWDMETLSYTITTPGEYTSQRELDFSPQAVLNQKEWLSPAPIAGVVNLSLSGTANLNSGGNSFPLTVNANGLLNLWSVAIETSGSVTYSTPYSSWYFNSIRAIYDFPSIEGRLFAGMVSGEGILRQSRPEIYGLALHNIETFSRYSRNYSPSVAFTLQKPSTVRIVINGQVVRTLKLEMGNYRIYDLPFIYGLNEFQLEVDEGKSSDGTMLYKPVTRYITSETGLLVGGKMDYGISAGVGRTENDEPIASVFWRYGLFSSLTVATNLQIDKRSLLFGLGFVAGTDLGGFMLDANVLDAWDERADPFAFAADLDYHYSIPAHVNLPSFGFSASYSSKGFVAPQPYSTISSPAASFSASANIGGTLTKTSSFGLSGQWNRVLDSSPTDTASVSLNFGFATSKSSAISFSSGASFYTGKVPSLSATFSLSASDPLKPGRQIGFTQKTHGQNSISFNDQFPIFGGIGYGIQANNLIGGVSDPTSFSINSGFSTRFTTISGSAGLSYGGVQASPTDTININIGTALSFAGLSFALSKPLYDSFIIFDPDRSTGSMPVAFSIDSGTRLISHGGPVAAPLSSYRQVLAGMDFPEADADVVATISQIALSSRYRSGFLFRGGLQKLLYVTGTLMDESGSPITYVAGDVQKSDGSFLDQTFTDDAGYFQIFGLTAGTYRVIWPENVGESMLTLTEDPDGLVELGVIHASPIQTKQEPK